MRFFTPEPTIITVPVPSHYDIYGDQARAVFEQHIRNALLEAAQNAPSVTSEWTADEYAALDYNDE